MSPVRLLTVVLLSLALALTMVAGYTVSPAVPKASATGVITAAKGLEAVAWARSRAGSPYRAGGTGPNAFDCSGLTRWVYSRVGRSLPHSSAAQAAKTHRVSRSDRRPGDLVFFYNSSGVYHVSVYAGKNQIWHASRTGTPVKKDPIWSGSHFYGRVK